MQINKIIHTGGSLTDLGISDSQLSKLAGEAMIKAAGGQWNGSAWVTINGENSGTIATIANGLIRGNLMAEVNNGNYLYSTVNATVYRDPDSWKSLVGTQNSDGKISWENIKRNSALDTIEYTKTGINYNYSESLLLDSYQTVDNMITNSNKDNLNQPYYNFATGTWIQGNTVTSSSYNMGYLSNSGSYAGGVLVINNTATISGKLINNLGRDGTSDLNRWLAHSNRGKNKLSDWSVFRSDGCSITTYDNQIKLLNQLKLWNLSNGYQIKTTLFESAYSKTPYGGR